MRVSNMSFLTDAQKEALTGHFTAFNLPAKINSNLVVNSLRELVTTGVTRTGRSGYSGGYATKNVWTADVCMYVCMYARAAGLNVECDNDAPKGGARGEHVKLLS